MKFNNLLLKAALLTSLLVQYGCLSSEKLISVDVVYEDFFTETIERIDCANFEKTFDDVDRVKINDKAILEKVKTLGKKFTQETTHLDVRGILILNYENQQIKYCFDRYGYFERNGISFENKQLFELLDEIVHFPK